MKLKSINVICRDKNYIFQNENMIITTFITLFTYNIIKTFVEAMLNDKEK